eukprot:358645-Chlamydomonas_euryale.AAC.9
MQEFLHTPGQPPVEDFGLQGFWFEMGERSHMKETVALQVSTSWCDAFVACSCLWYAVTWDGGHTQRWVP